MVFTVHSQYNLTPYDKLSFSLHIYFYFVLFFKKIIIISETRKYFQIWVLKNIEWSVALL